MFLDTLFWFLVVLRPVNTSHIEKLLLRELNVCCHTGKSSVAQLEYPIQSQYLDTRPTSPGTNLIL